MSIPTVFRPKNTHFDYLQAFHTSKILRGGHAVLSCSKLIDLSLVGGGGEGSDSIARLCLYERLSCVPPDLPVTL